MPCLRHASSIKGLRVLDEPLVLLQLQLKPHQHGVPTDMHSSKLARDLYGQEAQTPFPAKSASGAPARGMSDDLGHAEVCGQALRLQFAPDRKKLGAPTSTGT